MANIKAVTSERDDNITPELTEDPEEVIKLSGEKKHEISDNTEKTANNLHLSESYHENEEKQLLITDTDVTDRTTDILTEPFQETEKDTESYPISEEPNIAEFQTFQTETSENGEQGLRKPEETEIHEEDIIFGQPEEDNDIKSEKVILESKDEDIKSIRDDDDAKKVEIEGGGVEAVDISKLSKESLPIVEGDKTSKLEDRVDEAKEIKRDEISEIVEKEKEHEPFEESKIPAVGEKPIEEEQVISAEETKPVVERETSVEEKPIEKNILEEDERKETDDEKPALEEGGEIEKEKEVIKAGDFTVRKEASFEDINLAPEIQFDYSSSSEEEEEEEEEVEEEEVDKIDRDAAIEQFKTLQSAGKPIVKRNIFLLKKLAEHFKKRKMEHVYKTPEPYSADKELRYHKQLLAFGEIKTAEAEERKLISNELEKIKKEKDEFAALLKREFNSLIQKEREIGIGLTNTKTGKVISDKFIEYLLSKQTKKLKEVNEVRLSFIKLRDRVAVKEAQLQSLESFGENLHLIDYEQLRMENQNFADKIEERDEELLRLRNKATTAVQIMSHMKEKAFATDEKLDELGEELEYVENEVENTRGYVTDLKKRRDWLRSETSRLRSEAGLLTQPSLLRDFESSIEEATHLSAQVQNLKNSFYDKKQKLANVRKSIKAYTPLYSERKTLPVISELRPIRKPSSFVRKFQKVAEVKKLQTEEDTDKIKSALNKRDVSLSYFSRSPRSIHSVTPSLLAELSNEMRKYSLRASIKLSTKMSPRHSLKPLQRHSMRQSFRLVTQPPITKGRPSFFPPSYKTYMIKEKKFADLYL